MAAHKATARAFHRSIMFLPSFTKPAVMALLARPFMAKAEIDYSDNAKNARGIFT
jgi:hypothetical protein